MDSSVPGIPLSSPMACRENLELGQFKADCPEMPDRWPIPPVSEGGEVTASNLKTEMQLLPKTWEMALQTAPQSMPGSSKRQGR
jgi:hypothetical protein